MKRLIICCDGTWNELSRYPTNVVKLAQAVKPFTEENGQRVAQVVYYQPGLGTNWYDRIPGGAFGWGIDHNIQTAYEFLCFNYEPGDEIYLFGFSRGAYTSRSLAGMIYNAGLIKREHLTIVNRVAQAGDKQLSKVEEAYEIYRNRAIDPKHQRAIEFRDRYGVRDLTGDSQIPITLLGCWDTVGALGIPDLAPVLPLNKVINQRYRFHDHQLNPKIQAALHAVAIDERRKVFDVTHMEPSANHSSRNFRQVWFPGDHGCVGGGTKDHTGLSNNALRWMMDSIQALQLGLQFRAAADEAIAINPAISVTETAGLFNLVGVHYRAVGDDFTVLHESVKQRWQKRPEYRPDNLRHFAHQLNARSVSAIAAPIPFPVPRDRRVA